MPVLHHICGNCGKDLGSESVPTFGIADTESKTISDIDCRSCNPWYSSSCKSCRGIYVSPDGVCKSCKTQQAPAATPCPMCATIVESWDDEHDGHWDKESGAKPVDRCPNCHSINITRKENDLWRCSDCSRYWLWANTEASKDKKESE